MRIARGPDRELVQSCLWVHRVVLPMPVAVDVEEVVRHVRLDPLAEFATFVCEVRIGMVVVLVVAVGPNDGSGADENLPIGVARSEGSLEPLLLLGTPNR